MIADAVSLRRCGHLRRRAGRGLVRADSRPPGDAVPASRTEARHPLHHAPSRPVPLRARHQQARPRPTSPRRPTKRSGPADSHNGSLSPPATTTTPSGAARNEQTSTVGEDSFACCPCAVASGGSPSRGEGREGRRALPAPQREAGPDRVRETGDPAPATMHPIQPEQQVRDRICRTQRRLVCGSASTRGRTPKPPQGNTLSHATT